MTDIPPKARVELLTSAGQALFGERWKMPMSQVVGVDYRTFRRWAAGQRQIPMGVVVKLQMYLGAVSADRTQAASLAIAKIKNAVGE